MGEGGKDSAIVNKLTAALSDSMEKEIAAHGYYHKNALNQIQLAQLLDLQQVKNDAEFLKRQYKFLIRHLRPDRKLY